MRTPPAPEARNLHTAVWIGTAMIARGGELNTGDVVFLARDPQVAWYGSAAAVPSPDSDTDGFSVCAAECDDADGAACVESDDSSDTSASDADLPAVGAVHYYLIRAETSCPGVLGMGPLGFTSSGDARQGRACP